MKNLLLFLVLGVFLLSTGTVSAQKEDKKTKKEWKKKAKAYTKDPLSLKSFEEGYRKKLFDAEKKAKELGDQNSRLTIKVDSLLNELKKKDAEIAMLKSDLDKLRAEYSKLEAAYSSAKANSEKGVIAGLVFKVQIGAFIHFNMNDYLKETVNFEGESADNYNKYVVGAFRDLEVAEAFKKDIALMGIKDAWVVPYVDGVRVEMAEAKKILAGGGSTSSFKKKQAAEFEEESAPRKRKR
jgi:hypothetical protein